MATVVPDRCPSCHAERPANAPSGLCPRCLLRAGLDGDAPSLSRAGEVGATVDLAGPPSVRDSLAETVGPLPRILLRDTDAGPEPPVSRPASPEMPAPADRSARLHLFGEIARGGMGAILKGRDEDLGRDLAVKVLLEGHRDNADLIRRFVEEAQIGGQLQHPGIVPIYELGAFADRRPYFAMKLVKGQTMAALLAGRPSPADGLPRFLGIFEQISQTVAYAHARGVIHRDLKPSNVMVGSFGEVQVMDWGLAKVLLRGAVADDQSAGKLDASETVVATARSGSDSDLSRAGSVMGTPAYMAPEQARGEIDLVDERADVFALGSILCEVLSGAPAFVGRTSAEIQRRAGRGDTADALARLAACGAEAELLALARDCLAADPEDRPRDAGAVSARVTAHLAGVQERLRAAELERARAEARAAEERKRRRLQVGLAASLLALSVVGGLTFTYVLQQRQAKVARADRLLAEATLLRDQARERPEDPAGWQAALAALKQVGVDALPPEARARLDALAREVREGAAAAQADQDLLARLSNTRSVGSEAMGGDRAIDAPDASLYDASYEDAFRGAGLDVDALGPEEFRRKVRSHPEPVALALAAALDDWAIQRRLSRRDEDASWRRLVAAARAADPDPRRDELRALWERPDRAQQLEPLRALAARPDVEGWPAATLNLLANSLSEAGDLGAAVDLLRRAALRHPGEVAIHFNLARRLQQLRAYEDDEAFLHLSVVRALQPESGHYLAHALHERGDAEAAVVVLQDLSRLRPEEARHLSCLSDSLFMLRRIDEAGAAREQAVAVCHAAVRRNPASAKARFDLARALIFQANNLTDPAHRALHDEAIAALREAVRLKPTFAWAHYQLGEALNSRKKPDEAIAALREAVRIDPGFELYHFGLGNMLAGVGQLDEAAAEFREALRIFPDAIYVRPPLGHVLRHLARYDEAVAEFREMIRLQPENAGAHYDLGLALWGQGKPDEAAAEYREALRLQPNFPDVYGYGRRNTHIQGDPAQEVAAFRRAVRLKPDAPEARILLGQALIEFGRARGNDPGPLGEAVAEFREAARLAPDFAPAHVNLGRALLFQKEFAEAAKSLGEALRLRPGDAELRILLQNATLQMPPDEAIAALREAVRRDVDDAEAHRSLGVALRDQGRHAEAEASFREAIRLRPGDDMAHFSLARSLHAHGKLEEAIAEYRETLRLNPADKLVVAAEAPAIRYVSIPTFARTGGPVADQADAPLYSILVEIHARLGFALMARRPFDEAAHEFHEALRRKSNHAPARCGLGLVLLARGKFAEALEELRLGHEHGSRQPGWSHPSAEWIREAETLLAIAPRVPAILRGDEPPKDHLERLAIARLADLTDRPALAARLWAEAFQADPTLAENAKINLRADAARAAARAGCGQGQDDPPPDDEGRAELRSRALDWLRAELAAHDEGLQADAVAARTALAYWEGDPDLAGVRDPDTLAALPEPERADWQSFWVEVDRLLAEAGEAP